MYSNNINVTSHTCSIVAGSREGAEGVCVEGEGRAGCRLSARSKGPLMFAAGLMHRPRVLLRSSLAISP